jgi:hypothetical protein
MPDEQQESQGPHELSIGVGILRVLRNSRMYWINMCREWIDNSLGARAETIRFRFTDEMLEIIDDGDGCDDLSMMESPARSVKYAHNRASMYGIGGVMSQINASQGGAVKVFSVHRRLTSQITIDWNECIEQNLFRAQEYTANPTPDGVATGTKIRIQQARRIGDLDKLIADLGHDYAGYLRSGKKIIFEINGEEYPVLPFRSPKLTDRVKIDFNFQGHHITGFCGIVKKGVPNPYPAWNVHWGYRCAFKTIAPADGKLTNRIYGEIYLPDEWSNIVPTKDNFTTDSDDLWEQVGTICAEIIDKADSESTELELTGAAGIAGGLLTEAVGEWEASIKGRRPGCTNKHGTVIPTGTGTPHRNFTHVQPGDKPARNGDILGEKGVPKRIRIAWDETLNDTYTIDVSTGRNPTLTITLNTKKPIYRFHGDAHDLAILCAGYIAHEYTSNNDKFDGFFPMIKEMDYHKIHDELLGRIAVKASATTS